MSSCSFITCVSLLSLHLVFLFLFLIHCLCACQCSQGVGLTVTSAHVLVRAHVDGPRFPPTDTVHHTLCAFSPPQLCHCQRDWAVSIGWHMQQDIDISEASPHPGAPLLFVSKRSRLKTTTQKIDDNFSQDIVVICECCNACFPLRRAPLALEGNRCVAHSLRSIWPKLIPGWIGLPGKFPGW